MYIIEDEDFAKLLDGEFYQVIVAKKVNPNISIAQLYNYQFKYDTYNGFRKFYRNHLQHIIDGIKLIDNDSVCGKIIRWITNETKQQRYLDRIHRNATR